jgi:hypothetical protein
VSGLVERYGARLAPGAFDRRIPDLAYFELYDGIPVTEIGEDGDLVALGHHDADADVVAFQARLAALGCDLWEDSDLATWISRKWAVTVTGGCRDGDCPPASRYSSWHDEEGNCLRCKEIREQDAIGGWWLDFDNVTESTPDAFPITLCRI